MSPEVPEQCFSSITIQWRGEGREKSYLMFGVSKENYAEQINYLGALKKDWSINLYSGARHNEGSSNAYGQPGMVVDEYTCEVNRKEGKVSFLKNGTHFGWFAAFEDDELKNGPLYFAVSCGWAGQSIRVICGESRLL